jgi:hypothetical protein
MLCETCWADAALRHQADPAKGQAAHYHDLLEERRDRPCTPGAPHGDDGLEAVRLILSEVTGEHVAAIPGTALDLDQAAALFERLGFDPAKALSGEPDGRHCFACGDRECLPGELFQIVDEAECECQACHPRGGRPDGNVLAPALPGKPRVDPTGGLP